MRYWIDMLKHERRECFALISLNERLALSFEINNEGDSKSMFNSLHESNYITDCKFVCVPFNQLINYMFRGNQGFSEGIVTLSTCN